MKSKHFSFVIIISAFLVSCASISYPANLDKGFPPDGRYEILGTVSCVGKTTIVLGIIWKGGIGYKDLQQSAQFRYSRQAWQSDTGTASYLDVVNISIDEEIFSVLGVVTIKTTTMRGTVIRYTDT